ncbi:MAG: tetratricopeptide repeat protein [Candidatus Caldatribacteriota bacterium]|jgi:tetratricopeptide (TPR) repeat protein|nr:tetratricopeptide repeat protein [Atribacterota bacterium]MDD3640965.1 tetratricopeptide repeat protein [Atribacterota bacterium]MDD4289138.1 tetratricopeptide repeat protein [Atribacterota bacterium]MDD4765722.1 tetratricopeptide repeat protein [Atribacterota bacterium]MDD5635525.1 tetratricopeptide repeat protein [Atribacterota bacterium]
MRSKKFIFKVIVLLLLSIAFQAFMLTGAAQDVEIFSQTDAEAVELLQKAVGKMEEALDTYQAHYPGRVLWADAIDYAQQALEIDPNFIEGNYYLALMYQHTNWYYREAEQWKRYLELIERTDLTSPQVKQNLAYAYYRLGYNSYEKGDNEQSLIFFLNSIREYPDLIDSNYWAARVFYEADDLENSLFYWRRVLDLDPDFPRAQYFHDKVQASIKYGKEAYNWYEKAYNYYEGKNYQQAIASYQEAIRLNSRFTEAYYWMARVYFETGDYRRAVQNYQRVLELEPGNTQAEYWLKEAQKKM